MVALPLSTARPSSKNGASANDAVVAHPRIAQASRVSERLTDFPQHPLTALFQRTKDAVQID